MILLSGLVLFLLMTLLQIFLHHEKSKLGPEYSELQKNATISDLLSESVIKSWSSELRLAKDPAMRHKARQQQSIQANKEDAYHTMHNIIEKKKRGSKNNKSNETFLDKQFGDEPSIVASEISLLESLFEVPQDVIQPDWKVVLGYFDHYDDENWKDFLIKTEVPYFVRMMLQDSSESVDISRIENKSEDGTLSKIIPKGTLMSISTSSWILTHTSRFTLRQPFTEHDFDGTSSKNIFYFATPRLLVHNKVKDKWRASIIRHFDEKGLNMTFVDRDRMAVARRFFHRIDD